MDSVLEELLHQFFRKDLIYPSLKAVVIKYPQRLIDNESKVNPGEFKEITVQCKKIEEI